MLLPDNDCYHLSTNSVGIEHKIIIPFEKGSSPVVNRPSVLIPPTCIPSTISQRLSPSSFKRHPFEEISESEIAADFPLTQNFKKLPSSSSSRGLVSVRSITFH